MNWSKLPALRMLLALIAGILLTPNCHLEVLPMIGGCLLLTLFFHQVSLNYLRRWASGILILAALVFLGIYLAKPPPLEPLDSSKQSQIARIQEKPKKGKKYWKTELQIQGEKTKKALAYIRIDSTKVDLEKGDLIYFHTQLQTVFAPAGPYAFDYRNYLAKRGIHYQVFVQQYCLLAPSKAKGIVAKIDLFRQASLNRMQANLAPAEYSIAAALILGYKADLDEQVQEAYSGTGSMHVLAVSGLHVGMVALFVQFLLGRISLNSAWWKSLRLGLILAAIFFYALLSGAAPSVLRASTMFSFLLLGQALNRTGNSYNSLSFSALLLLCIEPNMLFYPGFQLSYSAVIGIIFFQPRIFRLYLPPNRFLDWMWQLVCVSIAAQLGTLPLSMYYFHQFPCLFWLSGLVVIPGAAIILFLGIMYLCFSWLSVINLLLVKGLSFCIKSMNWIIFKLNAIPYTLIQDIHFDGYQLLLAYICLTTWMLLLHFKKRQIRFLLYGFLLFFSVYTCLISLKHHQQEQIIIYPQQAGLHIDLIKSRQLYRFVENEKVLEKSAFYTASTKAKLGLRKEVIRYKEDIFEDDNFYLNYPYLQFLDKRFYIQKGNQLASFSHPLEVDYLILQNMTQINEEELNLRFKYKYLLLHNCRFKELNYLEAHDLKQDGFYQKSKR